MHPENTKENTQFGAFLIKNTVYEEQINGVIQIQHHFYGLPLLSPPFSGEICHPSSFGRSAVWSARGRSNHPGVHAWIHGIHGLGGYP